MRSSALMTPDDAAVAALVAEQPLAQLVSRDEDGLLATPLPLLLCEEPDGRRYFLGHMARGNPQLAALRQRPEALVLFLGEQAYISPSWLRDRTQAPTWNYQTLQARVRVRCLDGPDAARDAVARLTGHMERGRPGAWAMEELGERADRLLPAIVAFRADILALRGKFKLGQNERGDVLEDILAGLERQGNRALAERMREANRGRGEYGRGERAMP